MAITFVGSTSTAVTNTSPFSFNLPTCQENDIVIVLIGGDARAVGGDVDLGVNTSGYTEIADLYSDDFTDANLSVNWKRMGATPDTTVECVGITGSIYEGTVAIAYVLRGVDTTTALDVTSVTDTGIDSTIPDGPSITPVTSGALVVVSGLGTGYNDASVTAPSGYSNHYSKANTCSHGHTGAITMKAWSGSGAEDPAAWTDWTTSSSGAWCAVTMAFRPAGVGDVDIPISVSSVVITGYVPVADNPVSLSVGNTSLTVVGYLPVIDISADVTIQIGNSSITVSGQSVSLLDTLVVGNASVTLTGYVPEPNIFGIVEPGVSSISLTGQALIVINQEIISIASNSLTVKGFNPLVTTWGVVPEFEIAELAPTPEPGERHFPCGYWSNDESENPEWEFVEQPNLPLPYHKHLVRPEICGHWHKGPVTIPGPVGEKAYWQPSVDIKNNIIGVNPLVDTGGVAGFIYNGSRWLFLGWHDNQWNIYGEPNTTRVNDGMVFYYCTCFNFNQNSIPPGFGYDEYLGRLYVFTSASKFRYTDVWVNNSTTGTPYEIWDAVFHNVMDASSLYVACLANIMQKDGVALNRWSVKVSSDYGLSFGDDILLPTVAGGSGIYSDAVLRMSDDTNIWVAVVQRNPSSQSVALFKSNSSKTGFSSVWSHDYAPDTGSANTTSLSFDLSAADGRDISISLNTTISGNRIIYTSSNYGSSFVTKSAIDADYKFLTPMSAQGNNIIIAADSDAIANDEGFAVSTNQATSFNYVSVAPLGTVHSFIDLQGYFFEAIYCECGVSYSGGDYQDLLYSSDGGLNWTVMTTPIFISDQPFPVFYGTQILNESATPEWGIDDSTAGAGENSESAGVSSYANGDRAHFRFSHPGSYYGQDIQVFMDGNLVMTVPTGSSRYEPGGGLLWKPVSESTGKLVILGATGVKYNSCTINW